MAPPTQPLDPRVPQTPKPKWVTGEKTLCNVKCPDKDLYTVQLIFRAEPRPGWLVQIYKRGEVCEKFGGDWSGGLGVKRGHRYSHFYI